MTTGGESDETVTALRSVFRGGLVGSGGISARKALVFAVNLLLTWKLSPAHYGVYAFGDRVIRLLRTLCPVGTHKALVRYIPVDDDVDRRGRVLGFSYGVTFLVSGATAIGMYVLAPAIGAATLDHPLFVPAFRGFGFALPALVFTRVFGDLFRSLEFATLQTVSHHIAPWSARLIGAGIAILLGAGLVDLVAGIAIAMTFVVATLFVVVSRKTALRPGIPSRKDTRQYIRYSTPVGIATFGLKVGRRVDILLVGAFLSATATGVFNLGLFLGGLITLPHIAFSTLFPAVASDLYSDGDIDVLRDVFSTTTRWSLTAAFPIAIVLMVYPSELLAIFGQSYRAGAIVVVLFVAGRLVQVGVGTQGWLLEMTDHQYLHLGNQWGAGLLNLVGGYVAVQEAGLFGIAAVSSLSIAVSNLAGFVELWYYEGLIPINRTFGRPLAAAIVMTTTMVAIRPFVDGRFLVLGGTASGLLVYAAGLYVLGIDPRDTAVMGAVIRRE